MSEIKIPTIDFKTFRYFLKGHEQKVFFVFVTMLLAGVFESLNLMAIYPIINYGLELKDNHPGLQFLGNIVRMIPGENLFISSCVLLIALTVISAVVRIWQHYLSNQLIREVVYQNQMAIFDKYKNSDYSFFVKNQQGKLIYASTIAPMGVSNNLFYLMRIIYSVVNVAFFSVVLVILSWQGTLLVGFIGLLYVIVIRKLTSDIVNKSARQAVDEDRHKNVILNEFITGIKSIKIFLSESFWRKKFDSATSKSTYLNFKVNMGRIVPDVFVKFAFFMIFAILGIVVSIGQHSNILPFLPLLATFSTVASRLFPYMNLVGGDIVSIARFTPDVRIVYDLLNEPVSVQSFWNGKKELKEFARDVVFNNVWFKHEAAEEFLLKDLNLRIEKRKITAIVGPSGSGKTTIINLLLRLYEVGKGAIAIDGENIKEISRESYLGKIGYVSQESFVFNGTIRENIEFGTRATFDEIVEASKLANAHEFISASENGYDTIVGDSGMKISGGQRQRLAIARAMLRKPQILILDEATSSLDNVSERAVQEAINRVAAHTTILIVAHRLSTIQNADKIIVLEKGKVMEEGTHTQLLENKSAYFNLYTV